MLNDVDFLINFSGEIAKDGETGREGGKKREEAHSESIRTYREGAKRWTFETTRFHLCSRHQTPDVFDKKLHRVS